MAKIKMKRILLEKNNHFLSRSSRALASNSTFSKVEQFGTGKTPFCLVKGKGAYTWDVDNNKYIDYSMGQGCVILGHKHPVVDEAIHDQLSKGIAFSLPTPLEIEVAEMLINRIPSAEKVRFGKNGNDVTTAAVRLARYYTGNDHILFCGYHGWQDWYISQTSKNGGIPNCIGEMSHRFTYNDIESLHTLIKHYKDNVACIIMEPVIGRESKPAEHFLEKVRELATQHNIVLVFDEVVTGYRFHKFGAQTKFSVTPDLSCFGKAIANGMPLSALVGKAKFMSKFDDIFYSLTNAGETLSLAATKAVIQFYDQVDVPAYLEKSGESLRLGLLSLIEKNDLSHRIMVGGSNYRFGIGFFDEGNSEYDPSDDLHYWTQLGCSHGILSGGGYMVSHAHDANVTKETLIKYDQMLSEIKTRLC